MEAKTPIAASLGHIFEKKKRGILSVLFLLCVVLKSGSIAHPWVENVDEFMGFFFLLFSVFQVIGAEFEEGIETFRGPLKVDVVRNLWSYM